MRNILFTSEAWDGYVYWQRQDRKTLRKINELIRSAQREPFAGIGKPEALSGSLAGFWSRRIDEANRMVHAAYADQLVIISCRFHY